MKKILSVSMSIMLALSSVLLISCGNKVETIAVYGQFLMCKKRTTTDY